MEEIKLIEFLLNYNFRAETRGKEGGFGTRIVRIYLSESNLSDWIEYGLYDFDSENSKKQRIAFSLNKELINKKINYYYYDEEEEVFSIFLQEEVKR